MFFEKGLGAIVGLLNSGSAFPTNKYTVYDFRIFFCLESPFRCPADSPLAIFRLDGSLKGIIRLPKIMFAMNGVILVF